MSMFRATRHRFQVADDIVLLKKVIEVNPFSQPYGNMTSAWHEIAKHVEDKCIFSADWRKCRERTMTAIKSRSLPRSKSRATSEQYRTLTTLIQEVKRLKSLTKHRRQRKEITLRPMSQVSNRSVTSLSINDESGAQHTNIVELRNDVDENEAEEAEQIGRGLTSQLACIIDNLELARQERFEMHQEKMKLEAAELELLYKKMELDERTVASSTNNQIKMIEEIKDVMCQEIKALKEERKTLMEILLKSFDSKM